MTYTRSERYTASVTSWVTITIVASVRCHTVRRNSWSVAE